MKVINNKKNIALWGSRVNTPKIYDEISFTEENNNYFITIVSDGNDDYDLINLDTDEWLQLKRMFNLDYRELDELNINKPDIRHDDRGKICRKIWILKIK